MTGVFFFFFKYQYPFLHHGVCGQSQTVINKEAFKVFLDYCFLYILSYSDFADGSVGVVSE